MTVYVYFILAKPKRDIEVTALANSVLYSAQNVSESGSKYLLFAEQEERNSFFKACGFALMMCKDQCNQLQKMKSLLIELRKFSFKES